MRAHKRHRAWCILFFRERKVSFISAHASEQVSISEITPSISTFFVDAIRRISPAGEKKEPIPRWSPCLFSSRLSRRFSRQIVSHRSLNSLTVPIRKVDVPMLDESSACKQLHNDFGRRAWKFANMNSPEDATPVGPPSHNFYLFSSKTRGGCEKRK